MFVRRLFFSLKSQKIDVWDYSQRGEEIPPAKLITDVLEKQIAASDYLIAVVSDNSTDEGIGRFTHHEVKTAILKGMLEQGGILPIVLLTNPPKGWYGAYAELEGLLHLDVDEKDSKQYEEVIEKICRYLAVRYIPPFLGDSRMPLSERFVEEIKDLNLPVAQYGELMLIMDDFTRKFSERDWFESEKLISYFLMVSRYKIPEGQFYYPQIIKGICELQMGRFMEAEESFLQVIKNPSRDENSFGGLGQVYFRQQRYEEALEMYRQAHKICPRGKDLEIRFNVLGTQIEMGVDDFDASFLEEIDMTEQVPEDWLKVMNMKGIAYFKIGELSKALAVLESMRQQNLYDITSITYHYLVLRDMGQSTEAINLLNREAEHQDDLSLYHHLADLYLKLGMVTEALDIYKNKLCQSQRRTRQFMVEYARILNAIGEKEMVQEVCEMVLNRKYFRNPRTTEDFYYDGFANYLLGEYARARYDYERSSGFIDKYYDEMDL